MTDLTALESIAGVYKDNFEDLIFDLTKISIRGADPYTYLLSIYPFPENFPDITKTNKQKRIISKNVRRLCSLLKYPISNSQKRYRKELVNSIYNDSRYNSPSLQKVRSIVKYTRNQIDVDKIHNQKPFHSCSSLLKNFDKMTITNKTRSLSI
ncbi:MAG: hypothetical protein Sylvanvirus13_12 [Sylvanvirus sp.]|uniref:Uncharacterized protein n=1 Tax=Sylvanvirus sp. TaxID=2487774 RepID=A0A3G5AI64_9VIRU|nr:MAG: hypothetical protein Sylvanvirus13_12 [Sylvanvirus sp.]